MATIKKVTMADKAGLAFDDLEFSPEQYAQLERWRKNSDKISITLEQVQARLDKKETETPLLNIAGKKSGKSKSMEETVAATEGGK